MLFPYPSGCISNSLSGFLLIIYYIYFGVSLPEIYQNFTVLRKFSIFVSKLVQSHDYCIFWYCKPSANLITFSVFSIFVLFLFFSCQKEFYALGEITESRFDMPDVLRLIVNKLCLGGHSNRPFWSGMGHPGLWIVCRFVEGFFS